MSSPKNEVSTFQGKQGGDIVDLPPILKKIQEYLQSINIQCHENIEGEGRAASLMDEGNIKRLLIEKFPDNIIDQNARKLGDILVKDDNEIIYPINIKTSLGGTDNSFSKGGFVFALTNLHIEQIPLSMNLIKMKNLIDENRCDSPMKDYWFLCVDKKTCSVMIRGAKQIKYWVVNINPSNILQINWKLEKQCDPVLRTGEEAYNTLIENGVKESILRFQKESIPKEWRI
jgi:hypothetical protein